jgi:hypothetical protein
LGGGLLDALGRGQGVSGGQRLDHFAGQLWWWPAMLSGGQTSWRRYRLNEFVSDTADRNKNFRDQLLDRILLLDIVTVIALRLRAFIEAQPGEEAPVARGQLKAGAAARSALQSRYFERWRWPPLNCCRLICIQMYPILFSVTGGHGADSTHEKKSTWAPSLLPSRRSRPSSVSQRVLRSVRPELLGWHRTVPVILRDGTSVAQF